MNDKTADTTLLVSSEQIRIQDLFGSSLTPALAEEEELITLVPTSSKRFSRRGRKSYSVSAFKRCRSDVYAEVAHILKKFSIKQILFAPVSGEDLLAGIAAADIAGAPMALFLTNLSDTESPQKAAELMKEAVRKSTLCFANSEEIRARFQKTHNRRFWIWASHDQTGGISGVREACSWLWRSLSQGAPVDDRFERLCSEQRSRITPYVDRDPPAHIYWEFHRHYLVLDRLKANAYRPDFIVDVGASTGYWSHVAATLFPEAKFVLVEPLLERYLSQDSAIYDLHPEFVRVAAGAGKEPGEMEMNVSPDLYGSSFFDSTHSGSSLERIVIKTLDQIGLAERIQGRGILKIDVQFSEHLVLEGATKFLEQVDFIFVEASLKRFIPGILVYSEMIEFLRAKGFQYFDYAGEWRDSITGELLQQDVVFAWRGN